MKGMSRLQPERHHPLAPFLKVSDAPSRRHRLGAQGVTQSTGVPRSTTFFFSFFFFFLFLFLFFSSVRLQRAKKISNFFFSFLGPKRHRLVPILLKEQGPKWRRFGAYYFKIKNKSKWHRFGYVFHSNPLFGCFQLDNSSKFCPSLSSVVKKTKKKKMKNMRKIAEKNEKNRGKNIYKLGYASLH